MTDVREHLSRGRDLLYFVTEILGLRPNRGQMRWLRYIQSEDFWSWPYKRLIHVAANQIGKTLGVAILILWACIYKIGNDPSLPDFQSRPYLWIHLAPVQQQAYHALNDCRMLIKGAHPAQQKSGLAFRLPQGMVTETKVATYYDGLEFASGAVAQFRSTDDKASAIQGYRADAISMDEGAFEDHLITVVNEVFMMRLIASEGPLFLVSTPDGMNDFYELVEMIRELHDSPEDMVWLDRVRRWAITWSVIADNVGYGVTQEYVDQMELAIDPATKEQQLRGAFLAPSEAFFVPQERIIASMGIGEIAQARAARSLPAEQLPRAGRKYVIFWDPSVTKDPTAVVVLDVTRKPWTGVYFKHYPKPMDTTELLNQMVMLHNRFNGASDPRGLIEPSRAITGYDATSLGGRMWADMLRSVRPNRGFNFGGPDKKIKALIDLRAVLAKGELLMPTAWQQMRHEIMSYRLKDEKLRNDSVMALTGAVAIASTGVNSGARPFDIHGSVQSVWAR